MYQNKLFSFSHTHRLITDIGTHLAFLMPVVKKFSADRKHEDHFAHHLTFLYECCIIYTVTHETI
jgi:hypothetical protein